VQIAPVVKMYALTVDLPAPLLLGISKVAVHWAVRVAPATGSLCSHDWGREEWACINWISKGRERC
jgi:hypothetical protein